MVHGRPGHEISHFDGELYSPKAQNPTNLRAATSIDDRRQSLLTARSPSVEGTGIYRQYLPSACVDIRPSPEDGRISLFVILFVCTRISPPRIKLAASNFARRFIGILGRESPILGNVAPQKPKIACRPMLSDVRATFYL